MAAENHSIQLPAYQAFNDLVSVFALPISTSELHGLMCGYLCAGAITEGEAYLRALMVNNKRDESTRAAALIMFEVYLVSQQQLANFDFEFQLLLPDDHESLANRAQAFSEWCEGFTQALAMVGISHEQLQEEDSHEALQHLSEFAHLDYQSLQIDEDDEIALMEISEYTRMAVLRLYSDLLSNGDDDASTTH